jgi:hypothetical protein
LWRDILFNWLGAVRADVECLFHGRLDLVPPAAAERLE